MQNINETFCKGNNSGMFVTMFIGILDLTTGKLRYCNAGHEIAFLVSEENIRPLDLIANMPIGVFSDFKYESQEEVMESGTTLFTYTDGLTEAMNEERKRYGITRVEEAITSSLSIMPKDLITHIDKDVHKFVKEAPQSDDLTMLAIKYNRN
jgi:sigma-B regulation protein RsbU (phosphoserine phosphatase)